MYLFFGKKILGISVLNFGWKNPWFNVNLIFGNKPFGICAFNFWGEKNPWLNVHLFGGKALWNLIFLGEKPFGICEFNFRRGKKKSLAKCVFIWGKNSFGISEFNFREKEIHS